MYNRLRSPRSIANADIHENRPKRTSEGFPQTRSRASGNKRGKRPRATTKTVNEFNQWVLENAKDVGKWARANTKRLTGKEIL